jgi:membrane protein DedA with SNARE-associated domain
MYNTPHRDEPALSDRWRRTALTVALARYVVPLVAIPLIPVLLATDRLPLLVLLRPTKDFLLLGGGQYRVTGDPSVLVLLAAYLPLMLFAVWAFFAVGRAYRQALADGAGPAWLHRAVPPRQLDIARAVLARRGPSIAILGRLAALPPTVLAAAAGLSEVPARRYLAADTVGALASFAVVVGAGYALGSAWQDGNWWVLSVGALTFVALVALLTRWLRAEARRHEAADGDDEAHPVASRDG